MSAGNQFDQNQAMIQNYDESARRIVPGYDASHEMAAVLLRDRIGESGRILVVGAGGGSEILILARECPGWSFLGVDPSEKMLALTAEKVQAAQATDRVTLFQGTVEETPEEQFDAATAFLVLHFLPDDGQRLQTLQAIHARLKPGAPFLMIHGCADKNSPTFEEKLRRYAHFAVRNGAPSQMLGAGLQKIREELPLLSREREAALLAEAGFHDMELYYVAMWFHGWMMSA